MAVNFPDNPTNGDTTVVNGVTYTYNATNNLWKAGSSSSSGGSGGTTTYATAAELPQTATNGDLALVEETDKLYMWNDTTWYNIALINTAPSITQGGAGSYALATDGTPTVITLTATDPESLPVTWSYAVTSGSLTNGGGVTATVTQADNVFTITPTTTEAYAGTFALTFSVTDGANIVNDVNSFTLGFTVAMDAETVFSMGTSTTNALANNSFVDRSSSPITLTSVGSPVQSSFNPYLDNWSVYFDGSGDYLSVANDTSLNVLGSSFTIECWFYLSEAQSNVGLISKHDGSDGYIIRLDTNFVRWYTSLGSVDISYSFNQGQWYHIAVVSDGTTGTMYIDGQAQGSTFSTNGTNVTSALQIGRTNTVTNDFLGYIGDVRITNTAVYTSSFTPPTEALTAISGTQLLTCQSNRFLDNSTNGHTITANGNAAIYSFNPYGQTDQYSLASNEGSFANPSGTNSYLTSSKILPIDGSDFTLEFWFYWEDSGASTYGGDQGLFDQYEGSAAGRIIIWLTPSLKVEQPGAATITSSTTIREKTWYHLAFVINGGVGEFFLNGVSQGSSAGYINMPDTDSAIGTYNRSDLSRDYAFRGHISDMKVTASAKYTAAFTPPTEPLGDTSATFYLPSDNAGIFDKSGANAIAVNGDAQTSTTQTKYSSTSVYFDGTGDYLTLSSPQFGYGSGDFTVEGWFYWNNWHPTDYSMMFISYDSGSVYFMLHMDAGTIRLRSNNTGINVTDSGTWNINQWYHVALTREGSVYRVFQDGTEVLNTDTTYAVGNYTTLDIGGWSVADRQMNGYIEDLRITKGLARYTANFTPPTGSLEG